MRVSGRDARGCLSWFCGEEERREVCAYVLCMGR
jgi:hypothetical protein